MGHMNSSTTMARRLHRILIPSSVALSPKSEHALRVRRYQMLGEIRCYGGGEGHT